MPQIKFAKNRLTIDVAAGSNLMEALLAHDIPVASSCNGDGVCAKCKVRIIEGKENLPKENDIEIFRRERHDIPKDERLSCQLQVLSDIKIDTSYW